MPPPAASSASGGYDRINISDTQTIAQFGRNNAEGSGYLRLQNNGSNSVLIQGNSFSYFNGGNVGIGTTDPGAKFEIDGYVGTRDNPNNASEKALFIGDGNNGLYLNIGTSSNGTSAAFVKSPASSILFTKYKCISAAPAVESGVG